MLLFLLVGSFLLRYEARRFVGSSLFQEPPRLSPPGRAVAKAVLRQRVAEESRVTSAALLLRRKLPLPAAEEAPHLGDQLHQLFHPAFGEECEIGAEPQADAPALQGRVGLDEQRSRVAGLRRRDDGCVEIERGVFHAAAEHGAARARHPLALDARLAQQVVGAGEERRVIHCERAVGWYEKFRADRRSGGFSGSPIETECLSEDL